MEGITEADKIYAPIIINRRKTIMPDIRTMEEMYYITERFDEAVKKIKGMTQEEFSNALKTSQSAVARIESGNQNLTIEN